MAADEAVEATKDEAEGLYEDTDILVPVKRLVEREKDGKTSAAMFLHERLAEGALADGRKFKVSSVVPGGAVLLEFEKKPGDTTQLGRDRFVLSLHAFVGAVVEKLEG